MLVSLTELLLDLALEELHLGGLSVHQEHVARLRHADQLHYTLSIGVGAEGHVLHLQLHLQLQGSQRGRGSGLGLGSDCRDAALAAL